jgi:DNA-binding transcriptional LysR family regulator
VIDMRVHFLGLQAFVSIAERGSFHAAASHLNLSQTALSHRLRKLEEMLSVELIHRTTRQVSLTPAGVALLPRARRLFDDLGETLAEVSANAAAATERVTLGCLPTLAIRCLPPAMAAFHQAFPNTSVKILDLSATAIAERVQAGEAEFGVTIVAANRWDLELQPVAKEAFVLVCARGMPLSDQTALTWAQLQGLPLVRIAAETGNRILIDDALGSRRETLVWRYEVQRVTSAVSLVRSRIGYAIVPQLAYDVADAADLVAIRLRAPTVTRTVGIVTSKGFAMPPAARLLCDLVVAELRRAITPGE